MTWIKLNVGGHLFETHLSTLTTKCPNSILAKMFKSDLMHNEPAQGEVYRLDCDPQCFQVILAWLRHSTISIPATIDIKLVMKAAKQLGLDDLAKQLDKGCDLKGDMTDWLRLNVGGTIFETSRATLTSHPSISLAQDVSTKLQPPPSHHHS